MSVQKYAECEECYFGDGQLPTVCEECENGSEFEPLEGERDDDDDWDDKWGKSRFDNAHRVIPIARKRYREAA